LYFNFKNKQDIQELKLMSELIKPGDSIVDVGANIGFYAKKFSELTGSNGSVTCFEPDDYNYLRLLQTIHNLPNVKSLKAAVSSTTGQLEFYTSPDKNVDHRAYAHDEFATKYTVDCISLDEYLGENAKVDILKVDVQGFEMQVYAGAKNILENNQTIKIFSEFWPSGLLKAGSSKEAYFNFFTEKGFKIFLLKDNLQTLITEASLQNFHVTEEAYFNVFITR